MLPPDFSPVGRFILILHAGHALRLLIDINLTVAAVPALCLSEPHRTEVS